MAIVVDTSVIVAVIAGESERASLLRLTRGADLIAPHSVHWEVGNAFSAMLRRKTTSLDAVLEALDSYDMIPIRFVDIELVECLKIAAALGSYAYDAYVIRCALKYDAPLVSLDRQLVNWARQQGVRVLEVSR